MSSEKNDNHFGIDIDSIAKSEALQDRLSHFRSLQTVSFKLIAFGEERVRQSRSPFLKRPATESISLFRKR